MLKEMMMKSMEKAISKVLETMFFQPVHIHTGDCPLEEWFPENESLLGATLKFTGPFTGSSYLLIPVQAVKEMTANFLGLKEEEVDEEQDKDTVKETINMIFGYLLSLFDDEGAFKLDIPELINENNLTSDRLGDLGGDTILIKTGGNRMATGIVIN